MLMAYGLMCLIYGTTFLAIKIGLESGFPPFAFAALRFGAAGLMILVYLLLGRAPFPRSGRDLRDLAALGTCMTFVPFAALYWGEQHLSSGLAALLTASSPMMAFLIHLVADREKPAIRQVAGLLLGAAGICFVVWPHVQFGFTVEWLAAAVGILLSEFAFAWGAVFSSRLLKRGLAPLTLNGFQMCFGSMGLFALSWLTESGGLRAGISPAAWEALAYLTFFGSIVASGIYYWLVKRTNPVFPTTWVYVSPVIAMFAGGLFLHEPIRAVSVAGAVFIIAGVVLTHAKADSGAGHEAEPASS